MNTLKRSADTLERIPTCGYVEHIHSDACIDASGAIVCGLEAHVHTDACYQVSPDDVEIEVPELAETTDGEIPAELGDLALDLDDTLVVEDVAQVASNEAAAPVEEEKVFELGEKALVSEIIGQLALPVGLDQIETVGAVENDEQHSGLLRVEVLEGDWLVSAAQDFDAAELALVLSDDILVVKLVDGRAPAEAAEPADVERATFEDEAPVIDAPAEVPAATEQEIVLPAVEADTVVAGEIAPAAEEAIVEEAAEQPAEKEADAQSDEEEVEQPSESDEAEQPIEEKVEQPVGEETEEQPAEEAEKPSEDETDEQPTEEEAEEPSEGETDEQPSEEEAEQPSEEEAEQPSEGETDEQPAEEETEESADEETAEQPAEDEIEEPAEGEADEQPAEEETEESAEEEADEQPAEGEAEQAGEDAAVFSATIDMATIEAYPVSLNALMAMATRADGEAQAKEEPAPNEAEVSDDSETPDDAEAPEDETEPRTWTIEYDHELLEIAEDGQDYLVTPLRDFEETQVAVDNGSRYALTLVNCVLEADEAGEAPEVAYPAQEFEDSTEYVKVSVSAPEGAFPEGTTMTVADVADAQTLEDIEQTVSEDFVEVKRVHAVDISFFNGEDEIEPLLPISVVMTVTEIDEQQEAVVVHVDDEGAAEVVESQSEAPATEAAQGEAVGFEADSFSVYAVVVKEAIETKYIDDRGDTWSISVGFTKEANIPSGATLKVEEVGDEDYLSQAEATLEGGRRVTMARFFDISILDADGAEVQPDVPVAVSITLDNSQVAPVGADDAHVIDGEAAEVRALHFDAETPSVAPATETEATVAFDAPSFSVWGVVYTVDFYYGNYEYHLEGEGEIALSALFELLGIEADAADVVDVQFTDDTLVRVEQVENDWLLTSLAPFDTEETLTVTMADGTVYVVRVEDNVSDATTILNLSIINSDYGVVYASTGGVDYAIDANVYAPSTTVQKDRNGNQTNNTYQPIKSDCSTRNSWKTSSGEGQFVGLIADRSFILGNSTTYAANTLVKSIGTLKFDYETSNTITNLTAIFKKKGETFLYYITDGKGTVNGGSTAYGYASDNNLPAVAASSSDYIFDCWKVGDTQVDDPRTLTEDCIVTATFKQKSRYNVYYKSIFEGYTTPDDYGSEEVIEGNQAIGKIVSDSNEGWYFVAWSDEDGNMLTTDSTLSASTSSLFAAPVREDKIYYAYYVYNSDRLLGYANTPEAVTWGQSGSTSDRIWVSSLANAQNVSFTVADGYVIDHILLNGSEITAEPSGNTYTITGYDTISGLNTLQVSVKPAGTYKVTYTVEGSGTVSQAEEYVSDSVGSGSLATANSGNYFGYWKDENGVVVSTDAYFKPSGLTADRTFTAVFFGTDKDRIVFYSSDANQTISLKGGDQNVASFITNTWQSYQNAYPSDTTTFKYWEVEGKFFSFDSTIQIADVQTACKAVEKNPKLYFVRAVFSTNTSAMVAYKTDGNGTLSNTYDILTSIKGTTATANSGYVFDHWKLEKRNGELIENSFSTNPTITPLDLKDIEEDCVLTAVFRDAKSYTINYQAKVYVLPGYEDFAGLNNGDSMVQSHSEIVSEDAKATGITAADKVTYSNGKEYHFVGWWETDGNAMKIVETNPAFVPKGEQIASKTYYALFSEYPYIIPRVNHVDWGTVTNQDNAVLVGKSNSESPYFSLSQDITATPKPGFVFDHWEYDGSDSSIPTQTLTSTWVVPFIGIKELVAVFRPENSIKITYEAEPVGGKVVGTVTNTVDYLSDITLAEGSTAAALKVDGTQYYFTGWYIGDELFSTNLTLTSAEVNRGAIMADTTITAQFSDTTVKNKFTAQLQGTGTENGYMTTNGYASATVSRDGEGNIYKIVGEGSLISGTAITRFPNRISVTPATGKHFSFWMDDDGNYYPELTNATIIPKDNAEFTGYFAEEGQFTVILRVDENGKFDGKEVTQIVTNTADKTPVVAVATSDGYEFAGWFDQNGDIVSTNPTFDPSTAGYDMIVTARFAEKTNSTDNYASFRVRLADANGDVTDIRAGGKIRQNTGDMTSDDTFRTLSYRTPGGIIRYEELSEDSKEKQSDEITDVLTEADEGYTFIHWVLERGGKKMVLNHGSSNILTEETGGTNNLCLMKGDILYALFAKAEVVDSNNNASSDITFSDEREKELQAWMESINTDLQLFGADKTATVSLSEDISKAYENRVYQIDITAEASKSTLSSSMDMAFVLDASNSMKFPSRIKTIGKTMVLTQENLNDYFGLNDNGPYYIISDPIGTSTMFRIFKQNGTWYSVDAAYPDEDGIVISWDYDYNEREGHPPYAYPLYADADYPNKRLTYLNENLNRTIATIGNILDKMGGDSEKLRIAYNTFAASVLESHDFQTYDKNLDITVRKQAGGTRQDFGLLDAINNFSWEAEDGQRYAILITDGASVVSQSTPDYDDGKGIGGDPLSIRANVRRMAQRLKAEKGVKLITIGLSTKNVVGGSNLLRDIADPNPKNPSQKMFFEAESGDDLKYIMLEILQTIMSSATITGEVTDTVDPVFYPVLANGTPVDVGYYDMRGNKLSEEPMDGSAYYKWGKVTKDFNGESYECWQVTWYNHVIGLKTDSNEFHETFYVKAKEDFLGGNAMPTNVGNAEITAQKYSFPNVNGETEEVYTSVPTPHVNVDELALTQNSTEWTVYLGEEVDPKAQLQALFDKIDVQKVISGDSSNYTKAVNNDTAVTITSREQMLGGKSEKSNTFKLKTLGSLSDALTSALTDAQWEALLKNAPISLPYSHYGHNEVGTINISLTPQPDKTGLETSPHATKVVGKAVEAYTLTVTYVPAEKTIENADWHKTPGGDSGAKTDEMKSVNTHIINVFAKKLQIAKKDLEGGPLENAEFVLVRTARTRETEDYTIGNGKYHKVQTLVESTGGIHTSDWVPKLNEGEQYYLIETKAPAGYSSLSTPVEVKLSIVNTYPPDVTENPATPDMPYDWIQKASLALDSKVPLVSRRDAVDGADITNDGIVKDSESGTVYYWIKNNPGVALPATGGSGTAPVYILGSALIALALLGFVLRRKARDLIC